MRRLDNWLTAWLEYQEDTEPPVVYKKWVAISVVAACLQRKCYLNWGYITFYPNMYIVLVGPPGKCRKGTSMSPALRMLNKLGIKIAANSTTREALIQDLASATNSSVDQKNGTVEMHNSLTIFSPELTVFMGYSNKELISTLTDWYDCADRWQYKTKHQGTDDIIGVWVNLIGATTPELLQTSMPLDAIGGGLTSRMIFVYADKKSKLVPAPFLSPNTRALEDALLYDLEKILLMQGEFRITQSFLDYWIDWYTASEHSSPFKDSRFNGYVERRPNHILKLSCIVNAMRANGGMTLTEEDLKEAISLLQEVEENMPRVFGGVGKSDTIDVTNKVLLCMAEYEEITRRDLLHMFYYDADKQMLDRILQTLVAMGAISLHRLPDGEMLVKRAGGLPALR